MAEATLADMLRTIDLPAPVQENEARATFTDGLLELVLPMVAKPNRARVQVD